MRASLRRRIGEAGLLVGSVALSLAVAEAGLRLAGYVPQRHVRPGGAWSARERLLLDCYPTDPRGYFDIDLRDPETREALRARGVRELDAVAAATPHAVALQFNSLHFRDVEPGPRRPGVVRVVVLGDSFTEGQGVKEEDTYPRVLERLLDAGAPGRYEVRNCGRRAADFPVLHKMFERALSLEPDVLVYAMVLNDADRSAAFRERFPFLQDWILDRRRMLDGAPVRPPPLQPRLFALAEDRLDAWRIGRASTRWYLGLYGPENAEGWRRTQDAIRDMHRRTAGRGGRMLMASWPLLAALEGEDPFAPASREIARFAQSAGIPRHDLRPALAGRPTESLWVHPVDHHPNEVAHRLAAESLAPAVRALAAAVGR